MLNQNRLLLFFLRMILFYFRINKKGLILQRELEILIKKIIVLFELILYSMIMLKNIIILMSRAEQLNILVQQIANNEKFVTQVRRCVKECQSLAGNSEQLPTFAFQKAAKYPWSVVEGNIPVQGQLMIEQITQLIAHLIDSNLHQILSRQFINVTNQILVMREEINQFKEDEESKYKKMQEQFTQQMQSFKKKLILQQNMNSQKKQFSRTRTVNSSFTSNLNGADKAISKLEIQTLKKQLDILKKQVCNANSVNNINERLVFLEDKLQTELQSLRIRFQTNRQKSERGLMEVQSKMGESNNRDLISAEIKSSVKSYFKVYLQQLNVCKMNQSKLEENIFQTDKGLQEYIGNQLKTVWVMISNLKRRQQEFEEQYNMNNQSFILQ